MTIALAFLAILQGIFTVLESRRSARHVRTFRPAPRQNRERIAVFCPCKGTDAEFDKNIRSILEQEYGNYETHFIVESSDDPAYAALRHLGISNILVAGRPTDRGQKVHNLAYGVTRAGQSAAIYVFCDSDARFPHSWLSKLTAALDATNITTGYRWYTVRRANLPTLMRSAWNASSLGVLGGHDRNFAWGGSMAIYRQAFERLDILRAWCGAVSDDYAITNAAHREGMKIEFIPECLIPTYGECSWRELFEFTTRQIVITRVYHSRLWRVGFAGYAVFNAAALILPFTHPLLWLVVYLLSIANNWTRYRAVQTTLPPPARSARGWFYILCSPLVALLYLYNMISSALSTRIVWRQVHYRLISPHETRVFL